MVYDMIMNTLESPILLGTAAFLVLTALLKLLRPSSVEAQFRDMIDLDLSPHVREKILEIQEKHPESCRSCYGTATNPLFLTDDSEEEECPDCYAIGLDPYDTDKKLKKQGQYMVSTLYGIDPLYRGYSLPGGKLLAMIEEDMSEDDD